MNGRIFRVITTFIRLILSAVFIFSGFVKSVDPWGSAIKIGEYVSSVNLEFSDNIYLALSLMLCAGELLLGLMLLFGVWKRVSSTLAMLFMLIMTIVTLWISIWNPVADCGCFGDALKLTNWETFFKNLILLPISIILWRAWSRASSVGPKVAKIILSIGALATLSLGVSIYSLRYLPIIDFLPYGVGVDLLSDFDQETDDITEQTKLIYRDKNSGKLQEFTLEDTDWYDTVKWEYVETIVAKEESSRPINEFILFNGVEFVTDKVLKEEKVLLIAIWDMSRPLSNSCEESLIKLIDKLSTLKYKVYCITPSSLERYPHLNIGGANIETLNIDGKTLKSAMRSEVGVLEVEDGILTSKRSCYDAIE